MNPWSFRALGSASASRNPPTISGGAISAGIRKIPRFLNIRPTETLLVQTESGAERSRGTATGSTHQEDDGLTQNAVRIQKAAKIIDNPCARIACAQSVSASARGCGPHLIGRLNSVNKTN